MGWEAVHRVGRWPAGAGGPKVELRSFAWGDALIGGGAALGLTLLIGGTAVTLRPRHSAAVR
jgi:hypothetical protein